MKRILTWLLSVILALSCLSLHPSAASAAAETSGFSVVADSVKDFSTTQGERHWYYGYYSGNLTNPSFQQMSQVGSTGTNWLVKPGSYWTTLNAESGHPNGPVTAGAEQVEQWAVRRWVSDVAGEIVISGHVAKVQTPGGDGTNSSIWVDGQKIWSQSLAGADTVGSDYEVKAKVRPGSTVDFVIAPKANDYYDFTKFTALIKRPKIECDASSVLNPTTNHCYSLTDVLTWHEAQTAAKAVGGNLVTINDEAEQTWLLNTFKDRVSGGDAPSFWIGFTDINSPGTYAWVNGEPVTYTNWNKLWGEPNNYENLNEHYADFCAEVGFLCPAVGVWNDRPDGWPQLKGIIERP